MKKKIYEISDHAAQRIGKHVVRLAAVSFVYGNNHGQVTI